MTEKNNSMFFLTAINQRLHQDRCFGYFKHRRDALKAAENNWADMHECYYDLLVIEHMPEGLHPMPKEEIWFRWDDGMSKWIQIEKPTRFEHVVSFGIG